MALLDKLTTQGSTLSNLDGKSPQPTPSKTVPLNPNSLVSSNLDLDGKTPKKYLDNKPQ